MGVSLIPGKTQIFLSGTVATNATTSAMVDRLGFNYAVVNVVMRPATATDSSAKWTVLKLQHSDTTAVSSASDISGFIGTTNSTAVSSGTATEFVIPTNNNTVAMGGTSAGGGQTTTMCVDLRNLKRYLFLNIQGAASHQTVFAIANLFRAEQLPDSAAEATSPTGALAVGPQS